MGANSFNNFLRKYYAYNVNDEQEIRSHIYRNKLTNDITGLITIAKNTLLRIKFQLELIVMKGTIFLVVSPVYFEETTQELLNCLVENLRKNLRSELILIDDPKIIDENKFMWLRSVEL